MVAAFALESDARKFGDSRGSRNCRCSLPIIKRPFFLRKFLIFIFGGGETALIGSPSTDKSLVVLCLATDSSRIVYRIDDLNDTLDFSPLLSFLWADSLSIDFNSLEFDALSFS